MSKLTNWATNVWVGKILVGKELGSPSTTYLEVERTPILTKLTKPLIRAVSFFDFSYHTQINAHENQMNKMILSS